LCQTLSVELKLAYAKANKWIGSSKILILDQFSDYPKSFLCGGIETAKAKKIGTNIGRKLEVNAKFVTTPHCESREFRKALRTPSL
jgi:hypothetical protein